LDQAQCDARYWLFTCGLVRLFNDRYRGECGAYACYRISDQALFNTRGVRYSWERNVGAIFLIVRFSRHWATIHGIARLSLFALIPFVFPIVLALIFLFAYCYKPSELGVNARYWYLPFFINLLVGGITLTVAPQLSHWKSFFREVGFFNGLYTGLITAGLSEEFTRMLLQTRLGHAFHNKGLGLVAGTFIWASMHIPVDWSQNPKASFMQVVIGSSHLMPIGILWGYMTHRSKSLLPAVLTHGLNLWGLQNSL
jgi:membrane protease YdiL (CAAX protease family)